MAVSCEENDLPAYQLPGQASLAVDSLPVSECYVENGTVILVEPYNPELTFCYKDKVVKDMRELGEAEEALRRKRNKLLAATDWTQLPDVPESVKLPAQEYRQALRDLPETADPYSTEWPENPLEG